MKNSKLNILNYLRCNFGGETKVYVNFKSLAISLDLHCSDLNSSLKLLEHEKYITQYDITDDDLIIVLEN